MKAIVRDIYGSADVLELRDIDRPEIGVDEVLLRVHVAGVDQGVWHVMSGLPYPIRLAGYGLRAPKTAVMGADAVQLAKAFGLQVTGVCSTSKLNVVRSIGADHVIDYTHDDFAQSEQRYDAILDIGGNSSLSRLRDALPPKGTLVIVGSETDGRWLAGTDRQLRALLLSPFVGQSLGTFVLPGEPRGHDHRQGTDRSREDHAGHRPDLAAERGLRGHPIHERGLARGKLVITV